MGRVASLNILLEKEAVDVVNGNGGGKPWKYTDDAIAIMLTVGWILSKFFGVNIPDWVLAVVIVYAFGKSVADWIRIGRW